jgi:two-component system, NarL family, nitrate/nitrite response regulator NarL
MSLPAAKERIVTQVTQEYIVLEAEALLKRLIECVEHDTGDVRAHRRTSERLEEIIFEAAIDGISYAIVRSQPLSTAKVSLSPRELAIARLIAKGMPNKCIGDILEISPWTVATHLRRIFMKLGVTSRAAMVARLGEENLL